MNDSVMFKDTTCNSGTLMWIGDRDASEFQSAYAFCESNVAQLAYRADIDDAISRPASFVGCILLAQTNRSPFVADRLKELSAKYAGASWMNLQSSFCEGARETSNPLFDRNQHYWHRWNQVLPSWLAPCGAQPTTHEHPSHSVAVVASHHAAGDALMELAESAGATAIWCGNGNSSHVKNVDAVWWDDSAAKPASSQTWQKRIQSFDSVNVTTKHAWITNSPRLHQTQAATEAGIDMVVSKPHRIETLLDSLATSGKSEKMAPKIARAA